MIGTSSTCFCFHLVHICCIESTQYMCFSSRCWTLNSCWVKTERPVVGELPPAMQQKTCVQPPRSRFEQAISCKIRAQTSTHHICSLRKEGWSLRGHHLKKSSSACNYTKLKLYLRAHADVWMQMYYLSLVFSHKHLCLPLNSCDPLLKCSHPDPELSWHVDVTAVLSAVWHRHSQ